MNNKDIKSFFTDKDSLDLNRYIIETFWFETTDEPAFAAACLASEHSTAQWKRPGTNEDFRPKHAAKVIELEVLDTSREPVLKLPFFEGDKFTRCRVKIANPCINFGPKIPNLLTVVCGEGVFYAPGITSIKLLDLEFPDSYLDNFGGPKFGVDGVRKLLNVYDRPFFTGVVKPNVGLSPRDFADTAYEGWVGGLDIAKDDEIQADELYSPLKERTRLVNMKRLKAEDKTGEKKMFLANVTDEVDRLKELHDTAVENGVGAVMLNVMPVGLSAVRMLAKHASVPVVGHFDFIAPFTRVPFFGVSSVVITKLERLAGCDMIIMPGFGKRMMMLDDEVKSNVDECFKKLGHLKKSIPVPGGSSNADTISEVYEKLKTIDFSFVFGRGVFNHPLGAAAGARIMRQAWEEIRDS